MPFMEVMLCRCEGIQRSYTSIDNAQHLKCLCCLHHACERPFPSISLFDPSLQLLSYPKPVVLCFFGIVCLSCASYESRDETSKLPNVLLLLLLTTFSTCHCFPSQSLGRRPARRVPQMYDRSDFRTFLHNGLCTKYLLAAASIVATRHSLSMRILSTFLRFLSRLPQYYVTPPLLHVNIGMLSSTQQATMALSRHQPAARQPGRESKVWLSNRIRTRVGDVKSNRRDTTNGLGFTFCKHLCYSNRLRNATKKKKEHT
jgi:hypothetical protein